MTTKKILNVRNVNVLGHAPKAGEMGLKSTLFPAPGYLFSGHHQKPQFDPIPRYPKPSVPKIPESWTIAFPETQSTSLAGRLRNRYPVRNILQWETNYTASKFHGFSSCSFIFPIEIAI